MDNSKEVDVTTSVTESDIVEDEALQNVSDDVNLSTNNDGTSSTLIKGDSEATTPDKVQSESMADNEKLQDELEILSDPITEEINDRTKIELLEGDSQEWKTEPMMDDQELEDELETLSALTKEHLNDAVEAERPNVESEKEKSDSVTSYAALTDEIQTLSDPMTELLNDPTETGVLGVDTDEKTVKDIDDHEILLLKDRVSEDCKEVTDDIELSIAKSPPQNVLDVPEKSPKSCDEQTSGLAELLDKEEEDRLLFMSEEAVEEEKDETEPCTSISNETELMTGEVCELAEPQTFLELDVDLNDTQSGAQDSNDNMDHDELEESEAQVDNSILSETEDKHVNQTEGALTEEEFETMATSEMETESILENEIPDNEPETLSDPITGQMNDTNKSELSEVAIDEKLSKVATDEKLSEVEIDEKLSEVEIDEKLEEVEIDEKLEEVEIDEKLSEVGSDEKLLQVEIDEKFEEVEIDEKLEVEIDEKLEDVEIDEKLEEVEIDEKLLEVDIDEKLSEVGIDEKLSEVEIDERLSEVEIEEKLSEVEIEEKLSEVEINEKLLEGEIDEKLSEAEIDGNLLETEIDEKLSEVEVEEKLLEVEINEKPSEVEIDEQSKKDIEDNENLLPEYVLSEDSKEMKNDVELNVTQNPAMDVLSLLEEIPKSLDEQTSGFTELLDKDEEETLLSMSGEAVAEEKDELESSMIVSNETEIMTVEVSELAERGAFSELDVDLNDTPSGAQASNDNIDNDKLQESEAQVDNSILSETEDKPENQTKGALTEEKSETMATGEMESESIGENAIADNEPETLSDPITGQMNDTNKSELSEVAIDEKLSKDEINEELSEVDSDAKSEKDIEDNENSLPDGVLSEDSKESKNDVELNIPQSPAMDVLSLLEEIPKSCDEQTSESTKLLEKEEEQLSFSITDNDEVCIKDESAVVVPENSDKEDSVPLLNDEAETDKDFEIVADLKCDLLQESDEILAGESSEELTAVDAILIDEFSTSILNENVESLECLDNLEILPDNQTSLIDAPSEELEATVEIDDFSKIIEPSEMITENVDESPVEVATTTPVISHNSNYVSDVISSSTNVHTEPLADNLESIDDKGTTCDDFAIENEENLLNMSEDIDYEVTEQRDEDEAKTIEESIVCEGDIEMDLKEDEEKLIEQAVLEACDVKIGLSGKGLFDSEETSDLGVASIENAETSQQSSEISELECAVKFLQESEEHGIDSPLLSPKILEDIPDNSRSSKSCLFLSETEVCEDRLVLSSELEEITPDSIAISEAEIISEAAKLENEKKLTLAADMSKLPGSALRLSSSNENTSVSSSGILKNLLAATDNQPEKSAQSTSLQLHAEEPDNQEMRKLSDSIIRRSEKIPKVSILEERLKEPPKIEIPVPEISPRLSEAPTTPKTSLLIQRDLRPDGKSMYQKILDSPKGEKSDIKIADTSRKDSEKHDFENVGSPRIILKIAKSAITDCSEPRSPKSPKIRSAANSPNPEDSPGQKLGKIKLKLSKGGHPSIISNENLEDGVPRHAEGTMSLSPIGMKIKLSKTGDPSIVQPEKYDSPDDGKDVKQKFDDLSPKRTESPLGMKIKLSKTGDPSIVQDSGKETASKRKEKLEVGQENVKRSESSIGMKFKLSKSGDASIIQQETTEDPEFKEKLDICGDRPKRLDSPLGMKFKLSKSGDASIIPPEVSEDASSKIREKSSADQENQKRTDSPLGMKIKLSKSGGASIIYPEKSEALDEFREKSENLTEIKRVESPIGMKIKLSKSGDASIIHTERPDPHDENKDSVPSKLKERSDTQEMQMRTDSPLGMRIKVAKTGEASVISSEEFKDPQSTDANSEVCREIPKRNDSPFGMKIKLSKSGDASIIHSERQEFPEDSRTGTISSVEGAKSSESPLGIKFKLSKSGDASIIHPESSPDLMDSASKRSERQQEDTRRIESSFGMKIKLSKTGNPSIIDSEKKEKSADPKSKEKLVGNQSDTSQKRKEGDFPLEMKIKFSKTRHPTIITSESEMHTKNKDSAENSQVSLHKREDKPTDGRDSQLKIFKTGNSTIIQNSKSEVTIEPVKPGQHLGSSIDNTRIHDEVIISPVESKKSKLESKLVQMLPEVTIQPIKSGEVKQIVFDKKTSSISRQQMSVINQEISITQVTSSKTQDVTMSEKLKEILNKNNLNSPVNSDCEIIEQRPELIIVNENSNSSQDIMIIKEVVAPVQEVKVPRKRGRPKRSTLPTGPPLHQQLIPRDPLALDDVPGMSGVPGVVARRETDRPRRTCRNQKSYAPPKRGRGRGRGKRKMDRMDCAMSKVGRFEEPLTVTECSGANLIDPLQATIVSELSTQSSELYKALQHSPTDRKRLSSQASHLHGSPETYSKKSRMEPDTVPQFAPEYIEVIDKSAAAIDPLTAPTDPQSIKLSEMLHLSSSETPQTENSKPMLSSTSESQNEKVIVSDIMPNEPQNWLTPSIKQSETSTSKSETISMVQVLDEETRMSAESNSRSQTPARNVSAPAAETVINEESQGSVLSTATTESEKVKVKARRMEIQFDPDEGPFTVDKIAEYEWPLDKKGDTFMIQEQISQYLGVKSFKRKYPDLKRRMVEMEERNYLRENGLVSEAMCDMGLTAICSSEVLDVMCSDFPDQYEEYRKHMREKQAKEHSKKQKELTAAANAERNRIDLAEMAIQSALSWNVNFNKARKDSRKYSLDLQSFTIHVPKKQQKVDSERKPSNYPVALIPGQYTDYYREYTPAELRYYPLNTVLYGPMRPNERKFDSQSEGSQSDSDSDSSSDDSSSSSSEGTQDTEESQSTIDEDMEIATHKEENKNLKCKMCLKHLNKHGKTEVLIQCGTCNGNVHPSCIDLTLDMVPHIQAYAWQCTDCKNCVLCHDPADEDKMLFCDMCDRGYHIYCVGLRRVPQGRWHCRECAVCASCGLRQPGGANSDRNSVAQWQHEYKKGEKNTRVYVSTLCVPCSKLWRKGRYCPYCSRCHSAQRLDLEANLVHCGACDKYLHLGCAEIKNMPINRKNYICEFCSTANQQQSSKASISKPIQL